MYYKSKIPPHEAIRILLKNKGVTSNPVLLKAFINMVGIFPVGTLLKLDTGEVGLVMHQTSDLMRPRVLILTRFDGSEKEDGKIVSLADRTDGKYRRSISGTIDPEASRINLRPYFD